MDPKGRQPSLDFSLPDDSPQCIRTGELGQKDPGSTQLEGGVSVRASRAGKVVLFSKFQRSLIAPGIHTAGVEDLDRIHEWSNLQQVFQLPRPAAPGIKGMGDADERALKSQLLDCFPWREPGGNLRGHTGGKDFAAIGHDLLANNHQLRVQGVCGERAQDGIVVSYDDPVQPAAAGMDDEVRRGGEGILRGVGVGVKVY